MIKDTAVSLNYNLAETTDVQKGSAVMEFLTLVYKPSDLDKL